MTNALFVLVLTLCNGGKVASTLLVATLGQTWSYVEDLDGGSSVSGKGCWRLTLDRQRSRLFRPGL